jgi:hypothetical protein
MVSNPFPAIHATWLRNMPGDMVYRCMSPVGCPLTLW